MCAACAHGKADIGLRQGGGIVNAVAYHACGALALVAGDGIEFVLGQQLAVYLGNAQLLGYSRSGGRVVATEHGGGNAQSVQICQCFLGMVFYGVGYGKYGNCFLPDCQQGDCVAKGLLGADMGA